MQQELLKQLRKKLSNLIFLTAPREIVCRAQETLCSKVLPLHESLQCHASKAGKGGGRLIKLSNIIWNLSVTLPGGIIKENTNTTSLQ
jgi:hypothetical protein